MKNLIIFSILLTLFTFFNLSAQIEINQLIFNQNDSASVQFFFNESPDSIRINGEPVSLKSGQSLKLRTGIYTFEAFKNCYFTAIKKDTLISIRPKQVTFELNPLTPPEKYDYDASLYSNIIALPVLNTIMIANKSNNDYILPIALSSIVQIYWHWNQSNKMNPCSGKYLGEKINYKDLIVNIGISTQSMSYFKSARREVSYTRYSNWHSFTQKYDQELKLSYNSTFFIPNFAIIGELRKKIFSQNFFVELYLHSFIGNKIKFDVKEYYSKDDYRDGLARDYQAEVSRKYPAIVEASVNLKTLSLIDQIFFISIGGYWGNPFIGKNNFPAPVQQLYLPAQVYEKPEEIKYSQSSFGFRMGISWETPLTKSVIYSLGLKWYSTESSAGFVMLSSGFKYSLW